MRTLGTATACKPNVAMTVQSRDDGVTLTACIHVQTFWIGRIAINMHAVKGVQSRDHNCTLIQGFRVQTVTILLASDVRDRDRGLGQTAERARENGDGGKSAKVIYL